MDELTHRLAQALQAILDDPESLPAMRRGADALAEYKHRTAKKVFVPRLGMVPEDSRGG